MGCCNSIRVFLINMCDCHRTSNNEQPWAINASSFLFHPLLRHQGYFIPIVDVHLWPREQVSETINRFSKFVITTHLPLRWSRTEPRRIYRGLHQSVCDSQKSTTVKEYTYVFNSRIISYILNILIYVSMIMLDSLLQHPSVPDLPLPNPCVGALANSVLPCWWGIRFSSLAWPSW
jgi:hypothetical protein